MKHRNRMKQTHPLEDRLAARAANLREEAKSLPPGSEKESLLKRARQAEAGAQMSEWLGSPGLSAPS